MHSNGTLPLDAPLAAPLDARCGYALTSDWSVNSFIRVV